MHHVFVSFVWDDVSANRWIYFGILLLMAGEYAAARWLVPVRPGALLPAIYLFISVLFLFGIVLDLLTGLHGMRTEHAACRIPTCFSMTVSFLRQKNV